MPTPPETTKQKLVCHTAHALQSTLGIVLVGGLLLGCTASGTDANPIESNPPSDSTIDKDALAELLPIDRWISQSIGVALPHLRRQIERSRVDWAIRCVSDRGFEIPASHERGLRTFPPPPPVFGDNVESVINARSDTSSGLPPLDEKVSAAINDCLSLASTEFDDPLARYDRWIARIRVDLGSDVVTDPRMKRARAEEQDCIRNLGYRSGDSATVANAFVDRATRIFDKYERSQMSTQERDRALARLREEENVIAPAMSACINARLQVERTVLGELEGHVIEDEQESLREHADDIRERLDDTPLAE